MEISTDGTFYAGWNKEMLADLIDPFGGSGSMLIACEQTNRICYTIELDEKFADVIVNRYIEQAGSADDVFVERNGERIAFSELAGEVAVNG